MSVKLTAALGFAAKAGKVKNGDSSAEKLLRSGAAHLVLLDTESSPSTSKKWHNKCAYYSVDIIEYESPGKYMGKPNSKVFAITDENFSEMILQAYKAEKG